MRSHARIRRSRLALRAFLLLSLSMSMPAIGQDAASIAIPNGSAGIGFDDLRYSPILKRILVPAGRTGTLVLIDPATRSVRAIAGFSSQATYGGGHGEGITSVDEANGILYVVDRSALRLDVVNASDGKILAHASLASSPDYVRCVPSTGEIWVTEPDADRIEVFRLSADGSSPPAHSSFIEIKGGPESLVVDAKRGRAYTHLWEKTTLAIDLKTKAIGGRWPNHCGGSRGIALDEEKGLIFAGCAEGRAFVLDGTHDGKILGERQTKATGVDIIDYDHTRHHLYLPGGKSATMATLGVAANGSLEILGDVPSPAGGHCVVSDQQGRAYVCDPKVGRLVVVEDRLPSTAW